MGSVGEHLMTAVGKGKSPAHRDLSVHNLNDPAIR